MYSVVYITVYKTMYKSNHLHGVHCGKFRLQADVTIGVAQFSVAVTDDAVDHGAGDFWLYFQIGRASCRERV